MYEIPAGLDNGITHWAVTGKEFSEDVTQEETGVWFFGPEGMVVTFIPLDSGNEYRDPSGAPPGIALSSPGEAEHGPICSSTCSGKEWRK